MDITTPSARSIARVMHASVLILILAVGCGGDGCGSGDSGIVAIDGSSTVFPITEAVAEEFQKDHDAKVTIGVSGTGGGFKKFCNEETAITGASRPIKPSEVEMCSEAGVEYVELPIAYDGIAVVVHPDNDWVDHLTVEELAMMWRPDPVEKWSDIRDEWPDEEIGLYGPGKDSGTFDYFTKAIVGDEGSSHSAYTSSEDDNILVQGVSGDKYGLGFFGYAYYDENRDKVDIVPIDDGDPSNGKGPIEPTPETVADSTYQPLSRPVFIYVSTSEAERDEVDAFVNFYIENAGELAREVGYIALPDRAYELVQKRYDDRVHGSAFAGGSKVGVSVQDLLDKEVGDASDD